MTHRVFVYGTLLRGEAHHRLLTGGRLLGLHRTTAELTMLDLGAYPGVVTGGSTAVQGEIYEVDAQTLGRLDRLEGYPTLFRRETMPSRFGPVWIYLYRGARRGLPLVATGDWRARRS